MLKPVRLKKEGVSRSFARTNIGFYDLSDQEIENLIGGSPIRHLLANPLTGEGFRYSGGRPLISYAHVPVSGLGAVLRKHLLVDGRRPVYLWWMVLPAVLILVFLLFKTGNIPLTSLSTLLHGVLLGLSIAAPVGPMSIICLHRTVARGPLYGFASGVGNSVAIALYGAIAGFGVTFITSLLVQQQGWIRLIGGVFLVSLGLKTMLTRPSEQAQASQRASHSLVGEILSSFLLSVVNPSTILLFAAAFASIGMGGSGDNAFSSALLVLGILLGSVLWWRVLTWVVGLLRNKLMRSTTWMSWVNRLSGGMLAVLGVGTCFSLISKYF